ncbi:MAG: YceI family protein [Gemmatimonadota bacterium]
MWPLLIAALSLQAEPTDSAAPQRFQVLPERSVFAVVTHKTGFAARLAHNHFIVAGDYEAELLFEPDQPLRTSFALTVPVADLRPDDAGDRERWGDRVAALEIEDDLGTPGEDDRAKIREAMLSEKQLDVDRFPEITVRLMALQEKDQTVAGEPFPWAAEIALTVRGRTVQRSVPLRWSYDGTVLSVEGAGRFTFEEFGIEPYSAALGSVRNRNEFDIYLNLEALR